VFDERGATPREAETVHDRGRTAVSTATPGDLPMGLFQTADAVFVDTNTATRSDQAAETSRAILRAAHGAGVLTATDLDHRPGLAPAAAVESVFESMTESLDCLVASEDQIRRVLGESGKPREQATAVAAAYDLEMVVVTLSERGAVVLQDTPGTNVLHERGGLDGEVVDPAGAHAAFTGAFLERLTGGADAADALSYGVAAATLVRSLPGPTLQATPAELATVADSVGERSR
jgi:2-dehydro-3-deoxygluconokinase